MTANSEWTTYHLTPAGWVPGDKQRLYAPLLRRPAPEDRVLSIVYKVTVDEECLIRQLFQQIWCSPDETRVEALFDKFGSAPAVL